MDEMVRIGLEPAPGFDPEIALRLGELDDLLRRLTQDVQGLRIEELDWSPGEGMNSIGTLLLHIAAAEFDWIRQDVLGKEFTPEEMEWLRYGYPWMEGLKPLTGRGVEFHFEKLAAARAHTKEALKPLRTADLEKGFSAPDHPSRSATLRWILYHLVEHCAHHRGQIAYVKHLYKVRATGG